MITILCPSRGRPEYAARLINSVYNTCSDEVEILLYLNSDDVRLSEYQDTISSKHIHIGPDRSPVYSYNKLYSHGRGDIYFMAADHVTFVHSEWDKLVIDAFSQYLDKIAFVYPSVEHLIDDTGQKYMNEWYCPFYFLHRNWVDALGYFAPPLFWHWFPDRYCLKISLQLDRRHIIKTRIIDSVSVKSDSTDSKKHHLCNRERDVWLWSNPGIKRWIDADALHLRNYIENYEKTNSDITSSGYGQ